MTRSEELKSNAKDSLLTTNEQKMKNVLSINQLIHFIFYKLRKAAHFLIIIAQSFRIQAHFYFY